MLGHDWASPEATIKSYELFAKYVMPHFQGQLSAPKVSHDWATEKRGELFGRAGQAMMNAITSHVDEKKLDAEAAAVAAEKSEA
jgi:limonene 1,2-monooxygenase